MSHSVSSSNDSRHIDLNVGFYDPLSVFQGGFRTDFEKHVKISPFYWKDTHNTLRNLKNVHLNYIEQIPFNISNNGSIIFTKFIFVSCQNLDEYRSKVRPFINQWLNDATAQTSKLPLFIFYFEISELRTASDKYLKTNLVQKLKTDFPQVENIFKVKSLYQVEADKYEMWKSVSISIRSSLSDAINAQVISSNEDLVKKASIYKSLNQDDDALKCFSSLFNTIPQLSLEQYKDVSFNDIYKILDSFGTIAISGLSTVFEKKLWLLKQQEEILLQKIMLHNAYIKNVGRYAQALISFINSMDVSFKRNEISFILINRFLSNQEMISALETHSDNAADVICVIANLKLLLRNELISLGISKNLYLKGSMSIIDVQFPTNAYDIENDDLRSIYESNGKFVETIVGYTRDLINTYNITNVSVNTLALLTTELALILYYSTDEYETASAQLLKSYEFFLANGWKYIGMALIEVYIENLDKLVNLHGDLVVTQLLSSYMLLATNKEDKFDRQRFTSICSKLSAAQVVPIQDQFTITKLSRTYCNTPDVYSIDLYFKTNLVVLLDKVSLHLRNVETNETIQFDTLKLDLAESDKITLCSSSLTFGEYCVDHITLETGKLSLVHTFVAAISVHPIETFVGDDKKKLLSNTVANFKLPTKRNLNSDALLLHIKVGANSIKDLSVTLLDDFFENKLQVKTISVSTHRSSDTHADDVTSLNFTTENKVIHVNDENNNIYDPGQTVLIKILCFFSGSSPDLRLKYEINFTSIDMENNEIGCRRKMLESVNTVLPVAVAANETFKSSNTGNNGDLGCFSIFAQYTINSISANDPIRIHNVDLSGEASSIETWKQQKNVIAYMDQGTTFFYKLSNFGDKHVKLTIEYSTMKDEIETLMFTLFGKFLQEIDIIDPGRKRDYERAAAALWNKTEFKNNFYAMTSKIKFQKSPIDLISVAFKYIDVDDKDIFAGYIGQFLEYISHSEINVEQLKVVRQACKRQLEILVDIPDINIAVIVEYKFDKKLQYRDTVPVKICLDVFFVQQFSSNSLEKKVHFDEGHENHVGLDLSFLDDDQRWIISGIKKFRVDVDLEKASTPQGSHYEFDINFIPLKVGKLQLPVLEVKGSQKKNYVIELDYKNTAESVLVVSELNKIIHSF